jgi:hypothetical protein
VYMLVILGIWGDGMVRAVRHYASTYKTNRNLLR